MTLTPTEADAAQSEFGAALEEHIREFGLVEILEHLITLCDVLECENGFEDAGWDFAADALSAAINKIVGNDFEIAGPEMHEPVEDACND